MRDPILLSSNKQTLLSSIAAQAVSIGMPCYLVGGCVRDLLLGKSVNDIDIIVEGDVIKLGEALVYKHGGKLTPHTKFRTANWHLPESWNLTPGTLDLITARSETYAHPGALPAIKPSTIEDDIRRRDFTINAMAVRIDGEHFGELFDPLNGQADLEEGIIRVLHSGSFVDDPTRIFRAIRYEGRYAFKLDPETLKLINFDSLAVISKLSGERTRHELDLIFEEQNPALMFSRMGVLGVLSAIKPMLPIMDEKYFRLINSTPSDEFGISYNRTLLGYLLLLMDTSVDIISQISKRLDFNSELTEASLATVRLKIELPSLLGSKPSLWTARLEKVRLITVYTLWLATNESALKEFLVKWRHVKIKTTGDDLKARGIPPGPRYKEILISLRAAWLDGEVKNDKEEEELLNTLL